MSSTNGYPFMSKHAIAEKIREDRTFAVEVFKLLLARTEQRSAGVQGGFMASHKTVVRGFEVALNERPFDDAEHAKLVEILVHYAKQLAAHFRAMDLQARPELISIASTFSAIPTATPGTAMVKVSDEPIESAIGSSTTEAPAPKRRGRPPGAKTKKPRPEPEEPKQRRRRS